MAQGWENTIPILQPLKQLLDLSLITTYFFQSLRRVSICPKLRWRITKGGLAIVGNLESIVTYGPVLFDVVACRSRLSISLAACLIASRSLASFFCSFSSLWSGSRVAMRSKKPSSSKVLRLFFLIAASLLGPASWPTTTYDVRDDGCPVTRLYHGISKTSESIPYSLTRHIVWLAPQPRREKGIRVHQ